MVSILSVVVIIIKAIYAYLVNTEKAAKRKAKIRTIKEKNELAKNTSWSPMQYSTNRSPYKMEQPFPQQLVLTPTISWRRYLMLLFYGTFFLAPTWMLLVLWLPEIFLPNGRLDTSMNSFSELCFINLFALAFATFGGVMIWHFLKSNIRLSTALIFDKCANRFSNLAHKYDTFFNIKRSAPISLDDITALQLLQEREGGEEKYYSYELNLVLTNGKRIGILDITNLYEVEELAHRLSKFLQVPVWAV
ncbi:MAG: hypothetical protein AAF960_09910 [Bacteroidota bacterium]